MILSQDVDNFVCLVVIELPVSTSFKKWKDCKRKPHLFKVNYPASEMQGFGWVYTV